MNLTEIAFYFLSFLAIFSGLAVILSKNPVHSVLYLIVTFFSIAGHYFLMNAQVTKDFGAKWSVYVGGENLNNFTVGNPIVAANAPFGPH